MNRSTFLALSLAVTVGTLGCSDRDPSTGVQDRSAQVRFVNATADAASLTAQVEDVDRATGIGIAESSPCVTLEAGVSEITFLQPGVSTPVASTLTNLVGGGRFMAVATGAAASARVVMVETGGTAPPTTSTTLRVVNATGTLASVDVHVTAPDAALATPNQSGLAAHSVTPAFVVNAGDSRVRITTAGTSDVLLDSGALTLPGGQFRVFVITGDGQGNLQHFMVERCT